MKAYTRCLSLLLPIGLAFGLLGVLGGGLRLAAAAPAATYVVTHTGDSGPGSLRQALLDANASAGSDAISITTHGTVLLASPLPVITDHVTIHGPGADLFRVDGQHQQRVFDLVNVTASLSGLTIQHGAVTGTAANGAGLRATGHLTLSGVQVLTNTAEDHGGGLHATGSLTLTAVRVQGNLAATGAGGGFYSNGPVVVSGTVIAHNTSRNDGGGAFSLGALSVVDSVFEANQCLALACDGGGLFGFSQTGVTHTQFVSNTAQDSGGGASLPGSLSLSHVLFSRNEAVWGTGGGLAAQGQANIQAAQFLSNTARGSGGGLIVLGALTLHDARFTGNQSAIGQGGGLRVTGAMTIDRSQFVKNLAREGGGLAHILDDARVTNSLFAENQAANQAGNALLLASPGSAALLHLTIVGPPAPGGAGVAVLSGTVGLTNSIVATHTVGLSSTVAAHQDYNLFFDNSADTHGGFGAGLNSRAGDPGFAGPAGGDYHLTPGSLALEAGVNAGVAHDIDGEARPLGAGFDLGMDELLPPACGGLPGCVVYLPLLIGD